VRPERGCERLREVGQERVRPLVDLLEAVVAGQVGLRVRREQQGFVSAGNDAAWLMPPSGRNLHFLPSEEPAALLGKMRPMITSCAFAGDAALAGALRRVLPGARHCRFGEMQRPPFDGPVDRREL